MENNQEEEIWKPIKGFEDRYEISNFGKVKRLPYLLKNVYNKDNYPVVTFLSKGKSSRKNYCIHRLVAEHFVENPENKPTVNHKDGNKQNYHHSNLEWMTFSENTLHAYRTGLFGESANKGEANPGAKLKEVDVAFIKKLMKGGMKTSTIIKEFYPDLSWNTINDIKRNRTWKDILSQI